MDVKITPRVARNGEKIQYTYEWGKGTGLRVASGIFTFAHPANAVQRQYNKEALRLLEVKRCQLLLDQQAIGSDALPRMRFKANFLDFYGEYVHHNHRAIIIWKRRGSCADVKRVSGDSAGRRAGMPDG